MLEKTIPLNDRPCKIKNLEKLFQLIYFPTTRIALTIQSEVIIELPMTRPKKRLSDVFIAARNDHDKKFRFRKL